MADDVFGLVGTAIGGRYRVEAVVGEGGCAVVYRAVHLELNQPVAVKCLKVPVHFTAEARRAFLEQFRSEVQILMKLRDHPSIVRVHDFGTMELGPSTIPYLVLEWLEGRDLETVLLERRAPFGEDEALTLVRPALEAVALAHA